MGLTLAQMEQVNTGNFARCGCTTAKKPVYVVCGRGLYEFVFLVLCAAGRLSGEVERITVVAALLLLPLFLAPRTR